MELKLDGNSEIGAHLQGFQKITIPVRLVSETDNMICLRILIKLRAVANLKHI